MKLISGRCCFSGQRYFSKVFAVDAAGLKSETVVTKGFVPDVTPPVPLARIQTGGNLINNPSFEDSTMDWNIDPSNSSYILSVSRGNAKDGNKVVLVNGEISKAIETVPGNHYILSFYTTHVSSDENVFLHQEGVVEIPGEKHVFRLYHRENHGIVHSNMWQKNEFNFIADNEVSLISLKSFGCHGIYVDEISVRFPSVDY